MYYISTDATLTSANLHSALASLSDKELEWVLKRVRYIGRSSGISREQNITDFMMVNYSPTWEWVAGECFCNEQGKALEEMKNYFKRKLGMLLIIHRAHEFPCSLN